MPRLRISGAIPLFLVYFYGMHRYNFTFAVNVHIMKVLYVKFLKSLFDFKDMCWGSFMPFKGNSVNVSNSNTCMKEVLYMAFR